VGLICLSPLGLLATGTAARQRSKTLVAQHEQSALAQHMQQMERLISILSHDLRTPLAASRSTVDYLLLKGGIDDEACDLLAKVGDHQMRMAEMVTRMLDAMRIRSGAMEWAWGEVDIRKTLESARETVAALPVHKPEVTIDLAIGQDVSTIRGDSQSIRRLVENLVGNALRYTAAGKVTISAELAQEPHVQWLKISVKDTGEGMSREVLALLGQPFVLGGTQKRSGSGLGVGICSGICAAHGGRLTVRSRPGQGSEFVAWLRTDLPSPARSASEPRVEIVS
jgi:signal transduction histidine kinase